MFIGPLPRLSFYLFLYKIGDCPHLNARTCFTYYEEIGNCFRNLTKVQGDYVLSFLSLDSLNDGFK